MKVVVVIFEVLNSTEITIIIMMEMLNVSLGGINFRLTLHFSIRSINFSVHLFLLKITIILENCAVLRLLFIRITKKHHTFYSAHVNPSICSFRRLSYY